MTKISGKLVTVCVLGVALTAAGASWWFRYTATHRAARFWGPEGARLIRDAPTVYLVKVPVPEPRGLLGPVGVGYEISNSRGLTHLRNALLEDRSFDWTNAGRDAQSDLNSSGNWRLEFHGDKKFDQFNVVFTNDCLRAAVLAEDFDPHWAISTKPIAKGLRKIFDEFWSEHEPKR